MNNLIRAFTAVSSLAVLALAAKGATSLTLAQDGRANAVIVVEDPSNEFHLTAARDLQTHLQRASGGDFAIVDPAAANKLGGITPRLIVGAGALSRSLGVATADLEKEAYRIQTKDNHIVFVGNDIPGTSNATSWAVGCFLDRHLGVRWLWPGELGTHVPERKTIEVPAIDRVERPALEQRRLRSRGQGALGDWLRHHQMGSRMSFAFGHAFTGWWDKYHDSHPDYFAVPPTGQKQPYPEVSRVKLRIGNPAVADQIVENWRQAGRPDNWNVCPNDGSGWDTSAESRALDLPDVFTPQEIWSSNANLARRFVRFWNGLLVRVRQENPRTTLSVYAYSAYREVPDDVKLEPGMVVGVVHAYASTNGWQKWHAAGAKLILRPNWWHLGGSAPHLPLHAEGDYFRYAQAHGMIGFDFDSLVGQWGNQGVLYYLIARLSVRPELTVDQVIDEYTSAFGAAAADIREYLNYWEQFTQKVATPVPAGGAVSQDPNGLFETLCRQHGITSHILASTWQIMPFLYTDEVIAPAARLLKRARQSSARETDVVRNRISYLEAALGLLKEHREVIRLADKKWRKPGETDQDFLRQMGAFEARRKAAVEQYGPIGFDQTIPSRLRITDPRELEGR